MHEIVEKVIAGDVRTVARLIGDIDDRRPEAWEILKMLYPHTGHAYVIGITGAPGVGKSTLVDQMVGLFRERDQTVGVLAIDPTSPFSGGAILGDRIRMQRHSLDKGVYVRSLATRGYFGGLSRSSRGAIDVLDAMGKDIIIVDTAGRLHTKTNLMEELKKIKRVIKREIPDAPHETLLVLDSTTGQNAISQAKLFNDALELSGIVLTKLDGTAKGGIVIAIKEELNIPIILIGIGEKMTDLRDFVPEEFLEALFQ